ncbi:hypothetical protein Tsubulata_024080 [Turnera subulata]|uniref:Diacylglycerol O-acyltransferase n=1 Tax=Turnera subulata TaxID=218843 RepID=A0A9Q0J2A6_9ROSI|nr:hypothetical protein Tsubulata_024080 [Turnera subulata]
MAGSTGNNTDDEPLTPAGRLFVRPELDTIIHCVIGAKLPLDIEAIKETIKNSLMVKHPRFRSLLVRDKHGVEHWRRTELDVDRHIIVVNDLEAPDGDGDIERVVNDYVAGLSVSTPLAADKPLWEVHLLMRQRSAVLRIHHALGDGISLMSMFLASCRKANDPTAAPTMGVGGAAGKSRQGLAGIGGKNWGEAFVGVLKIVWFTLVYCLEFLFRCLFIRDRETVFSGGDGVELWPRKLATAKFLIEDMKLVKKAVGNATINDVLLGVISSGLSRYLDHRSPKALQDGLQVTGVALVNLRDQSGLQDVSELMKPKSGTRWGNRFGIILIPICYHKGVSDPLLYVKKAKAMIDKKKRSLEAYFSYWVGHLILSLLGTKAAYVLNYRVLCNTTFTISNVVGPQEEITLVGNPVTFLRVNTSSIPHALTMHMVSYAGRADMQILVAKDLIPDPEFLAKCFEDSLLAMKQAAAAAV